MTKDDIDALFSQLTMAYGTRFRDQWAGQPAEGVKRLWRRELASMPTYRVRWAARNLPPDFPPNAMQFRALCAKAPAEGQALALEQRWERPSASMLARMQSLAEYRGHDPMAWLERLQQRAASGEHLGKRQLDALRELQQFRPERGDPDESTT